MNTHAVLIVKNEATTIRRCLESCIGLVQTAFVYDTGSTDGTADLAVGLNANLPFPVKVKSLPWGGFGPTRTAAIQEARRYPATRPDDLLLLLDADQTVRGTLPPPGDADGYSVPIVSGTCRWPNVKLIRAGTPWRYEGRAHEYLTTEPVAHHIEDWTGLTITEHSDGGGRPPGGNRARFVEDLAALKLDLLDKPDDPRTWFYLARTYDDLGQFDGAITAYRKRVVLAGYDEERFYALYRIGCLTASVPDLLRAWDMRPQRWEPVCEAAKLLRLAECYRAAYALTSAARTVEPATTGLFLHTDVYAWDLDFEHSISAWRTGRKRECAEVSRALLAKALPAHVRAAVARNLALC